MSYPYSDFRPPLNEMASTKKAIEIFVRNHQFTINNHLIKIMAVLANNTTREHWRGELRSWFADLGNKRWKSNNKPLKAEAYFKQLWIEPFDAVEIKSMQHHLRYLKEEAYTLKPNIEEHISEMITKLESFQKQACILISEEKSCNELINNFS